MEVQELEARIDRIERELFYKDAKYRFSNGNVIFRNGIVILPDSDEGKTIQSILDKQKQTKETNERQSKKWEKLTGKKRRGVK